MAICACGTRTNAVPTALRGPSIYATASVTPEVLEVGIFNTTTTAVAVGLARATAATNAGTGLTEVCLSDPARTVLVTGTQTHTGDGTIGTAFMVATLGAAIGAGVIWTFRPGDLEIPVGTANGWRGRRPRWCHGLRSRLRMSTPSKPSWSA